MLARPTVCRLMIATACASVAPAAHAIVYRNDMTDAQSLGLANQDQFKATGKVNNTGGTGTLILPDWVITAKHVTGGDANGTAAGSFTLGGTTYTGRVYANPNNDFSLIHLTSGSVPASAATPIAPGFFGGEAGKLVWLVGYGRYETVANQAATKYDGKLRAGTNVVREYQNPYLLFDNANTNTTSSVYESSTGPGDSGGPMYQQINNAWYVVGEVQGAGGSGFTHTPTNPNKAFILDTIRTVSGNTAFNFTTPAGPTSLTWDSDVTVDGHNDGSGVWDTQRPNFRSDLTGFNYQWDNAAANDVTFGRPTGTSSSATVTIQATNVASGTLVAGGAGPVYAAGSVTVHNLSFVSTSAGGYTIAAAGTATLKLVATAAGDPTIAVKNVATISAPIESTAATITKTDVGRLVLSGDNGYTGTLQINAGTVQATRPNALPGFATAGRVTVAGGAGLTLSVGGTGFTPSDVAALLAAGPFQGAGTLGIDTTNGDFTYAAPLTGGMGLLKSGVNSLTLTAPATYSGPTTFYGGTLALTGNGRLPSGTHLYMPLFSGGGTLSIDANISQTVGDIGQNPAIASTPLLARFRVVGPGTVVLSGNDYGSGTDTDYDFTGLATLTSAPSVAGQAVRFNGGQRGNVSSFKLAADTKLTYAATYIGYGNDGIVTDTSIMVYVGRDTTLNTDKLQIGNYHATGYLRIDPAATTSVLRLRGASGGDSRLAEVIVGYNTAGAQSQSFNTLDTFFGTIDARVGRLTVGTYQPNTGTADAGGSVFMGRGTLDADEIILGYAKAANAGGAGGSSTGTFLQSDGTVRVGTLTLGAVANASQTATRVTGSYEMSGPSTTLAAATITAGPNTANAANTTATRKLTFTSGRITTLGPGQDLTISGLPGGGPAAAANKTLVVSLAGTSSKFLTAPAAATIRTTDSVRIEGTGGLTIDGPGSVELAGPDTYTGRTVVSGGTLRLQPAAVSPVLTLGGVDVQNGRVVFVNASAGVKSAIAALLDGGYDTNFATGQFISTTASSTRGLGYRIDAGDTLTVAAALYGDADLNGLVDFNDFATLQTGFGQSNATFGTGDFDYNGVVDFNDFARLQTNFGQSLTGGRVAFTRDEYAAVTAFGLTHAVPEPAAVAVVGAVAVVTLRRRVRRGA